MHESHQLSASTLQTKESVLKTVFGYDSFYPIQAGVIDDVCAGKDALVLMPTGGGKSLCFQVPALMLPGLTIVISPLIALMKDQVEALKQNGVKAEYLNSSQDAEESRRVLAALRSGELKLLYVSPERLFSGESRAASFLDGIALSLIAVDEAHCISFWGHDFRPEYTKIGLLREFFPGVPLIALTATADQVIRRDILAQLNIPEDRVVLASFDRPNIRLEVREGRKRIEQILDFLRRHPGQGGIIYALSRASTEDLAERLSAKGYKAKAYHAGMSAADRSKVQEEFLRDDLPIVVATIAFGMGIDKSNVRWVIHYNLPKNLESYYQEIGRAGRDGADAEALLFYSYADVARQKDMIAESPPERREILDAKLERMKQYAESRTCRRRVLLAYFNEYMGEDCGRCDVCLSPPETFDGTLIAQKFLSAVARTGEKATAAALVGIVRGSLARNVTDPGWHNLKTFGVARDLKYEEAIDYLGQLLNSGRVDLAYDRGRVFTLNEHSRAVLKGDETVALVKYRPPEERVKVIAAPSLPGILDEALFEHLKAVRKRLADENQVPAYIIFSDKTLKDMASRAPRNSADFRAVSGVGEMKLEAYGSIFLREIEGFLEAREDREMAGSGS